MTDLFTVLPTSLGVRATKAAESAAAIQKAVTSANLVVAAENALALENATKRKAAETVSEQKAEAAKVSSADQGQLARKRPKKKVWGRWHLERSP